MAIPFGIVAYRYRWLADGSRARRASAQPGRPPVEPAGAGDHLDLPKGGDAGAGARAGPHAREDCGGDPRCSSIP